MKICFQRKGHANNSSSAHSVIIASGMVDEVLYDKEYGWEEFILASKEEKTRYLASLLRLSIINKVYDSAKYVYPFGVPNEEKINELVLEIFPDFDLNYGSIDHQSVSSLPFENTKFIKFLFSEIVNRDDLVIKGGNDNGTMEKNYDEYEVMNLFNYPVVVKSDPDKNVFAITSKSSGDINIVAENGVSTDKLWFPYLVDLCITHTCNYGCKFCYMNSKPGVSDVEIEQYHQMQKIIYALAAGGCSSIVIGGGEPTTVRMDYLRGFINAANGLNVSVGMTTNNFDLSYWHKLYSYNTCKLNSVAFSVNSTKAADDFYNVAKEDFWYTNNTKVYAQVIVGATPKDKFLDIVKSIENSDATGITFLGWKDCDFVPFKFDFIEEVLKVKYVNIGFDSVLVNEYKGILQERYGVKNRLLVANEGKHTCFIDTIDMTMAPSSFCDKSLAVKIDKVGKERLKEIFDTF